MKLPTFKRLNKTDFQKEFQSLVEALSFSINIGIESVYTALNRNITFSDNIASTVYTFSVEVDSDGIPKSNINFNVATTRTLGIIVVSARTSGSSLPTSTPFCSFEQNNKTISINYIKGLPADQVFTLTIIAIDN